MYQEVKPLTKLDSNTILRSRDYTVSGKEFELRHNEKLDMLETFPRPEIHELPEYYKSEEYISHTDSSASFFDKVYQRVKNYMIDKKLNWIEEEKKSRGLLLDIGTGTGDFLVRAKSRGWIVKGIEPNEKARKLSHQKGIPLEEELSALETQSFDVITMWHVLEHVPRLEEQIEELSRLLKKDGIIVIAVPNFKSYDAKIYEGFWAAYDVPRHLWHFSRNAIQNLFHPKGFRVMKEKGLPFDSYYVSLLSEKYRTGSRFPLSAIWNGYLSNKKARKTGEYSSIAYFLVRT